MIGDWINHRHLGLGGYGENVLISRHAVLINPNKIFLGSNVRIDAFCVLSAGEHGIHLGDYVHLGVGATLYGGGGNLTLQDFVQVSAKASIYTCNDDFEGGYLAGPMVPEKYRNVHRAPVRLERHAMAGAGSVILPGATLGWGSAIGALSLLSAKKSVPSGELWAGVPAKFRLFRDRARLAARAAQLQIEKAAA